MSITQNQRDELLSLNDSKPFIITQKDSSEDHENFSVQVFVRTTISSAPKFVDSVSMLLSFPSAFPIKAPLICVGQCRFFHPNFTDDGQWLEAKLENNESLSEYLMRLIRVLQYKEIDTENVANRNAMAWYNKHRGSDLFPTDPINYSVKPRISIHRINENIQPDRIEPIQIGAIHYE